MINIITIRYAASRKVEGSRPDKVKDFYQFT
jgi:hypothetical protein